LLLSGCGGGGGGVGIAEGQGPDPVILDVPIAYVKRPVPVDDDGMVEGSDARELLTFEVGADLFLRERASPTADDRNLTAEVTEGLGDVRDLDASFDGTKLVFAMRGPFLENVDDDEQPTWNIWEYDLESATLRRIIASDITAEAGHDVAPHYLPDGRIVFSSTRQRRAGALLLDEGKPQFAALDESFDEPAFVLHVMNEDGSEIEQISFNQSHDLDPTVVQSGQVVFSRWDNASFRDAIHLYRMNPDGTGLELLYGFESHETGTNGAAIQFLAPREMPDGTIVTVARPFESETRGGDLLVIDTQNYLENDQPNAANAGVLTGPAQQRAVVNAVTTDGTISPGGSFQSVYPLWDGTRRMLVSWSQCRLVEAATIVACTDERLADPAAEPAPPLYGIWIYDRDDETQLPVVPPEEGFVFSEAVAAQPRPLPTPIPDLLDTDPDLAAEGLGRIAIRSVYDVDGLDTANPDIATLANPVQTPPDARPARFLRIVKAVGIPDEDVLDFDNSAFGRTRINGMREIIGYVPIEPDGSVVARVPANTALQISVVDGEGKRRGRRHNSWLQLRPGQTLECNGCHDPSTARSHGRADAFDAAWAGAGDNGPFPGTDPAIFADFGETMAEARARLSCATDCAAETPSVDVVYEDVWTDETVQPKADAFAWRYADLETDAPVSAACQTEWSAACRIVLHYETHVHPLWSVARLADDGITDATCTTCHAPTDAMGAPMVPAGQLDLTDGPSVADPDQFKAYRELLFGDLEQEVVMGALQDRLVEVGIDPDTGDPIFETVPVAPSMSAGGARASAAFFAPFAPGGSHAGWLSDAELRLLAEWLDVGAQYFNNPFDAPID